MSDYNYKYLRNTMVELSNILYNASQSNSVTKDSILNSIKGKLQDYNSRVKDKDKIDITDFRK